jgi:hypothetical protein
MSDIGPLREFESVSLVDLQKSDLHRLRKWSVLRVGRDDPMLAVRRRTSTTSQQRSIILP